LPRAIIDHVLHFTTVDLAAIWDAATSQRSARAM
jgi:hypothetical protein